MHNLKNGMKREDIHKYFISVANQENLKNQKPIDFSEFLIKNNKKNLLIVLKNSIGDVILSTSLLQSFRKNYPQESWNIYYATEPINFPVLEGNQNIDKILPFQEFMLQEILCTGAGKHIKGYFDAWVNLGANSQIYLNYLTNSSVCLPQCKNSLTNKQI